jgi:carbon monoxide dehydrogenase subunit G
LPSIVEASEEIIVHKGKEECYAFCTDLANIGSCIPGCEQVSVLDSQSAVFKVKVKVGYISKTFELKAKLKDVSPPNYLSFSAAGSDAEISGRIDLAPRSDQDTGIRYSIEIRPVSVTGKTAISMIGKDLVKKQASEFASCVKKKLEE